MRRSRVGAGTACAALALAALVSCSPDSPVDVSAAGRPGGPAASSTTVTTAEEATTTSVTASGSGAAPSTTTTTRGRPTTTTTARPTTTTTAGPECAPVPEQFGPYVFDTHLAADGTGFAAGTGTIRYSTDGGASWAAACVPDGTGFVRALDFRGQRGLAAGMIGEAGAGFVLRSTDGGRTWRHAQVPPEATYLMDVAFTDDDHAWAVGRRPQTDGTYGPQYGDGALLVHSVDGGATWKLTGALPPDEAGGLSHVTFPDTRHGWTAGQTRSNTPALLATSDGGATWALRPVPADVREIHDVVFVDEHRGWITAATGPLNPGDTSAILATTDGGATWTGQWQGSQTPLSALEFTDAEHGWALANPGAGGTVLATTDGGATWTATLTPGRALTSVSFSGTRHGWLAGLQGAAVYVTADGGATWATRPITGR